MRRNKLEPPVIRSVQAVRLPAARRLQLSNGLPVVAVGHEKHALLRVEAVVRAGRPYEMRRVAASATERMLVEGAAGRPATEINESLEYVGAEAYSRVQLDVSGLVLKVLPAFANQALPHMADMLFKPDFTPREFNRMVAAQVQRLQIETAQADTIGYRRLSELIFGTNHWYGYNSMPIDYQTLTRDDLVAHHSRLYVPANMVIVVAGRIDDAVIESLDSVFGAVPFGVPAPAPEPPACPQIKSGLIEELTLPDNKQASLWIGRPLFDRNHPDYAGVFLLNVALGGYFGSRLMSVIREKNGLTYNISSNIDMMWRAGCWYISAEVNRDKRHQVVKEVRRQMRLLQQHLLEPDELDMLKRYVLGNMLGMVDGALAVADVYKLLWVEEVPLAHFDDLLTTTQNITAEQIRQLACKYLNPDDWAVVLVS